MSRVCQISGKKPVAGNKRSHALNATKRRFCPNLQKITVINPKTGKKKRMRVAASSLRTLTKKAA